MKHGADSIVLKIQMMINNRRAFFRELRRCNGRTIATYLQNSDEMSVLVEKRTKKKNGRDESGIIKPEKKTNNEKQEGKCMNERKKVRKVY